MREEQTRFWIWFALGPLTLAGCIDQTTEAAPESTSVSTAALETENALSENGLSSNGLSSNGLSSNGLSSNGLSSNGLIMNALKDATTGALNQQFLSYLVSCALPQGKSISLPINGVVMQFDGQLGLAPEWGASDRARCDVDCQQWISACLIARVNAQGHHIPLSMRGSKSPSLSANGTEKANYPNAEATYFGNIFSATPQRFACKVPGSLLINRACGAPDVDGNYVTCVANVLGNCDNTCNSFSGGPGGYYADCHPADQPPYHSITVYRQSSDQDNPVF